MESSNKRPHVRHWSVLFVDMLRSDGSSGFESRNVNVSVQVTSEASYILRNAVTTFIPVQFKFN